MIRRGRDSRLDAVARTYLHAEAPQSRLLVVAGEDVESTAAASRAVQRAACDLGVPTVLLTRGSETVDMELGADRVPPLVVYHHGCVREAQLSALRPGPEHTAGPDLLLWDLPRRDGVGMRSMYLMGLWAWSMRPRQLRCVLPPPGDGDPPLKDLRERVKDGVAAADATSRPEVLQRPGGWEHEGTRGLVAQILQSMLAGSRRASARAASPGTASQARAWGWAVALTVVLLAGMHGPSRAQDSVAVDPAAPDVRPELVTIEIDGLDLDDPRLHRRADGTRVAWGPTYLLRLEAGVGTRSEGSVSLTTPRAGLFAREGDEALDWTPRSRSIGEPLLLDAPEFTLQARSGRYEITAAGILVTLDRGSVVPGREGLMLTGVMVVVIVLLFVRAGSMRRKLDRPYESVRRRRRTGE